MSTPTPVIAAHLGDLSTDEMVCPKCTAEDEMLHVVRSLQFPY